MKVMTVGTRTSCRPRRAPTLITWPPSKSWKIAATTSSCAASAATSVAGVNARVITGPASANASAKPTMMTSPVSSAPKPMGRSASVRPSPLARLMRMLTASDNPSGNMKASDAQPMAIWCAASGTVPSQPIISADAANAPPSNSSMPAAGTPSFSSVAKRPRSQPVHGADRTGANVGEVFSHSASAATAANRAISVAQPEPTRPSAGKPRCPNTNTQLRNAFSAMSASMMPIGTHGRPRDSANCRCTWKNSANTIEPAISR